MEEQEGSSTESRHAPGGDAAPPGAWLYGPPDGSPQPVLASALTRLAAFIGDVVLFVVVLGSLVGVEAHLVGSPSGGVAAFAVLLFCYSPLCTAWWGGTPGKLLFGIRVVRARDGRPLTYGRALGRHMSHFGMQAVPLLNIINNARCVWNKPLKQCFHDVIAASVVVERPRRSRRND
ncbi:RDD family protein [Streptomyces sp. MA15]|uniref:RDD family protein n=1 Tax=Streptomyces sp. MA15 TaxID=3055061 RepID=UPI0025AF9461|nr:RDD family protein [Streptomyces sp. MA15]MDN3269204.1 RDD family protein [Streptomyces sp. MA15]